MPRIFVCLAPLSQVFRHPVLCWSPHPPGIFPLHLQDSPDGLLSLSALYLRPKLRALSLTPAHTEPLLTEPNRRIRYKSAHGQVGIICPTPTGGYSSDHTNGLHPGAIWRDKGAFVLPGVRGFCRKVAFSRVWQSINR